MAETSKMRGSSCASSGKRMTIVVPYEFFNIKFIFKLMVIILILYLAFAFEHGSEHYKNILDGLIFVGSVLTITSPIWILIWFAYRHWNRIQMAGYWDAVILIGLFCVCLLVFIFYVLKTYATAVLLPVGIMSLFVGLFVIPDVWSHDCLFFFRSINGKCPACHSAKIAPVRKNREWICPSCSTTITWRKKGKMQIHCPTCNKIYSGATTEMIGDLATCPSCNAEFEIT
ncbi:MAG: hypothetical protein ABSE63_07900 [Thermoguttaceae bacterium]|jgi:predicted Zn-ribbon and HTH transcriptional regulator